MIEINIWFFIITALILVLGNIILMLKINPHKAKKNIHKNIDPSWALQMEDIL